MTNPIRELIRDRLTAGQYPMSLFELSRGTEHGPVSVRQELQAMQDAGEVERAWPFDQEWWWLTSDTALNALASQLEGDMA